MRCRMNVKLLAKALDESERDMLWNELSNLRNGVDTSKTLVPGSPHLNPTEIEVSDFMGAPIREQSAILLDYRNRINVTVEEATQYLRTAIAKRRCSKSASGLSLTLRDAVKAKCTSVGIKDTGLKSIERLIRARMNGSLSVTTHFRGSSIYNSLGQVLADDTTAFLTLVRLVSDYQFYRVMLLGKRYEEFPV